MICEQRESALHTTNGSPMGDVNGISGLLLVDFVALSGCLVCVAFVAAVTTMVSVLAWM